MKKNRSLNVEEHRFFSVGGIKRKTWHHVDKELINSFVIDTDIPKLHDRMIAATARYLDIPLITNDPEIKDSEFVNTLK